MKGVSAKYMRRFYITVSIPHMLYTADLFLMPQVRQARGSKGFVKKLGRAQRHAALHATGVL